MSNVLAQIQSLPMPAQLTANGAAAGTAVAAFFEQIHGPAATVVVILSGVWFALQITGWIINLVEKFKRKK